MILAGLAIGEHGFNILARDSSFELFGKVGLYYIMFLAGLEMNMGDFKETRNKALVLGLLAFIVPIGIGFVSNVKCLTFANADVAEFTVPPGAKITKHLIKDLGLPKGTTIGGMIRNGEGILVTGDTLVQPGDHVVVFCLSMMIKKIEKFFN